jgi:hypothetical protein
MIVYHGTSEKFKNFEKEKIYSGEGVAKRGYGFNFSIDPEVAIHYFNSSGKDNGYIIKASVPDKDYLLNLDETVNKCLPNMTIYDFALELAKKEGVDLEDYFEQAMEDEDVSLSYSDNRAREMFERFVVDATDDEAMTELKEWSPGYDWKKFEKALSNYVDFEFDANWSTGESLYEHLTHTLGGTEKVAEFLSSLQIGGTYGHEPISKDESAISVVVFNPSDINILERKEIKSDLKKQSKNRIKP